MAYSLPAGAYTVTILYAKPLELDAISVMLDDEHNPISLHQEDHNEYILGRIGKHNVVIAGPPRGEQGKVALAHVATALRLTFPNIKMAMLVGIGGGVPQYPDHDVRLGDVVVGAPEYGPSVVEYDLGKQLEDEFVTSRTLNKPPEVLRNAVNKLELKHKMRDPYSESFFRTHLARFEKWPLLMYVHRLPPVRDQLFISTFSHPKGSHCESHGVQYEVQRHCRPEHEQPSVHYSTILSGGAVMKSASHRDNLSRTHNYALCFEMEAAGLMDRLPCLVIRGIGDYADSHKNAVWQGYAAATAAAYAREVLLCLSERVNSASGAIFINAVRSPNLKHPDQGAGLSGQNPEINLHWRVPHATNSIFTGRRPLLQRIEKYLTHNRTLDTMQLQKRFVITGLGGQGKSEVCLRLAEIMRQKFWGVFWVDVSTPQLAQQDYVATAKMLGYAVDTVAEACQLLSRTTENWLLILDNADDPQFDYQIYFPSGTHGTIVMTSRNSDCSRYSTVGSEALTGLDTDSAVELLLKVAEIPPDNWGYHRKEAEAIVQLLTSHTLALIQAGAYIAKGHTTLAGYPRVFHRQSERILKYQLKQGRPRYSDVYNTFEASAGVLSEDAVQVLNILSMLHSSVLSLHVFESAWEGARDLIQESRQPFSKEIDRLEKGHIARLPGILEASSDVWDNFRLVEAVTTLASLHLVIRDAVNGIRMHTLAHSWARTRQSKKKQKDSWITAGTLLAFSIAGSKKQHRNEGRLYPHAEHLTSLRSQVGLSCESEPEILPIVIKCGWVLEQSRNNDSTLYRLVNDICQELSISLMEPIAEFMPFYDLATKSLQHSGYESQSVELLRKVVHMRQNTLPQDHLDLLNSQQELARACSSNGKFEEAIDILLLVVEIHEHTRADDDPIRLQSQHDLATAYLANGQIEQAISLFEYIERFRSRTLPPDHLDRLLLQHDLARACLLAGQGKRAVHVLEGIVPIWQSMFTEGHPHRLASEFELAMAYKADCQYEKSVELLEYVIKTQKMVLPVHHYYHSGSRRELAGVYLAKGDVKRAIETLEDVVKGRISNLPKYHHRILRSQFDLALAYRMDGQLSRTATLLEQVFEARKMTLGVRHAHTLTTQYELGETYLQLGQPEKAVPVLQYVVEVYKETLPESHTERLASQNSLARATSAIAAATLILDRQTTKGSVP